MAWFVAAAQAAGGGITSAYAGYQQAEAAKKAAQAQGEAGQRGAAAVQHGYNRGSQYAREGQQNAMGQYGAAEQYARQQQAQLNPLFSTARGVGGTALQRYQDAVLNGNQGGIRQDSGFGFRQQQSNPAAARLAQSAGLRGGELGAAQAYGGRYADNEYATALQRAMAMGAMGSQATATYAGYNQNAADALNRVYGARAGEAMQGGQFQAQMRQNYGNQYANALTGNASNISNYEIQGANALANTYANMNNIGQNAASNMLFYQMMQNQRPQRSTPYVGGDFSAYTQNAPTRRYVGDEVY